MWSSSKSINSLVRGVFCNGRENKILELEASLERYKNLFVSPLQSAVGDHIFEYFVGFKPKNAQHRQAVKRSVTESISLPGVQQKILLTQDLVDEVLVLSDLFDANELIVVELLLTAESQLSTQPHLSRGLLAVLLYYDAHYAIIDALRTLIQARSGRMWTPTISIAASRLAEQYTEELWKNGLPNNILNSLQKFDIISEFQRLEAVQALGSPKHRHDVFCLLSNIRNSLSECFLLWACQSPLNLEEFKTVVDHIIQPKITMPSSNTHASQSVNLPEQPTFELDHAKSHVLMALLYTLEPFAIFSNSTEQLGDLSDYDLTHPMFTDPLFCAGIGEVLDSQKNRLNKLVETDVSDQLSLIALLRLGWAICLRRSVNIRSELCRRGCGRMTRSPTGSPNPRTEDAPNRPNGLNDFGVEEDDEAQANSAIEYGALEFARKRLLPVSGFERETMTCFSTKNTLIYPSAHFIHFLKSLWVCRLHSLVTDLLVYMPGRVREIRMRDEDLLRRTGFDPSSNGSGFANLLLLIAELYDQPGCKLHARLALEYWWPAGELAGIAVGGTMAGGSGRLSNPSELLLTGGLVTRSPSKLSALGAATRVTEATSLRQTALLRFVRSTGDMISSSNLFIPYLHMLHGLVGSRSAAGFCFSLLKANSTNQGRSGSFASWDHFFSSFRQYLSHMKQPTLPAPTSMQFTSSGTNQIYPHLYGAATAAMVGGAMDMGMSNTGSGSVRNGMHGFTGQSAASVYSSTNGTVSAATFASGQARAINPEEQAGLMVVLRLISRITRMTEMDEVEPRVEEYPITRAFLTLITVLAPQLPTASVEQETRRFEDRDVPQVVDDVLGQGQSLVALVSFLVNSVFLKHTMRAYRDANERWDIAAACLVLFDGFIGQFLRRLNAAAAVIICGDASHNMTTKDADFQPTIVNKLPMLREDVGGVASDWATTLLNALHQLSSTPTGTARAASSHPSACDLLAQLRLPAGWPSTDPGFFLVTQLLSDSSLFRTLTGLLEIGLHRILEFPLICGPPPGMLRSTAAGLRLIKSMLANEDIVITFVRRTAVATPCSIGLPVTASMNALPTCLSRLLMSINSRTGRADLLPMLLKYCSLLDQLPDHCAISLDILAHLLERIKPHGDLLALLAADSDTQGQLMHALASLLKWPSTQPGSGGDGASTLTTTDAPLLPPMDCDAFTQCFSDQALFGSGDESAVIDELEQLTCLGVPSGLLPHPATHTARACVAMPEQTPHWTFPEAEWEFWATWPETQAMSSLAPCLTRQDDASAYGLSAILSGQYQLIRAGNWLYDWVAKDSMHSFNARMLHLILAALDYPAPNLSHWLLGFRIEGTQAVSHTVLQDAGIGDQPHTCLHAILNMIDFGLRHGGTPSTNQLAIQWNLALCWQIIYRLAASPLTSEPVLRYLRGNHDLLAKHLQFGLHQPASLSVALDGPGSLPTAVGSSQTMMELLSLNQIGWFLRTLAIELRTAAAGNQRSYVARLLKLLFGGLLTNDSEGALDGNVEVSNTLLAFLCRLKIADPLLGPSSFELRSLDAHLTVQFIADCELMCPLLASDSTSVRKASSLIHPHVLFNRLYIKLLATAARTTTTTTPLSPDDLLALFVVAQEDYQNATQAGQLVRTDDCLLGNTMASDLANLYRWVESRNLHRLRLYAGKQSAFEAWREMVEIGCGLINRYPMATFPSNTSSSAFPNMASSNVVSEVGMLLHARKAQSTRSNRPCYLICLDILDRLLNQLCASEDAPTTLRLLASGTLLHLTSFLHGVEDLVADRRAGSTESDPAHVHLTLRQASTSLVHVVQLLTRLTLQTRSSAQRMRANLYGALCYLLRFSQRLSEQVDTGNSSTPLRLVHTQCLSAVLANTTHSTHWSQTEILRGAELCDAPTFYCLLVWDLLRSHSITQMAVISVLELLLPTDHRSTRDLLSLLCRPTVLQHVIESIPEDLSAIESIMMPAADSVAQLGAGENSPQTSATATTAFHMYRAKLSLLSLLSTTPAGAKALIQSDLIHLLTASPIYSGSTLATCYADTLSQFEDTPSGGPRSSEVVDRFTQLQSTVATTRPSDDCVYHKLIACLSEPARQEEEDMGIVPWSELILPVLRLLKTLLITLGPNHVSANQQITDFLYTHADALLAEGTALLGAALSSQSHPLDGTNDREMAWLTLWLSAQTSLTELLVLVSRNQPANSGLDEYSTLQLEVVESKILRHTMAALPTILPMESNGAPVSRSLSHSAGPSRRLPFGFEYLLCETQQLGLIRLLVAVCTASLHTTGSLTVGMPHSTRNTSVPLLYSLLGHTVQDTAFKAQTGVELLCHLLSWSMEQLSRLEELCVCLVNLNIFDAASSGRVSKSGTENAMGDMCIPVGSSAIRLLLYEQLKEKDVGTNELRQAATFILNCSPRLSASMSLELPVAIDGHRGEITRLRDFVSMALSLLRIQLRSLISISEQTAFLVWSYSDSRLTAALTEASPVRLQQQNLMNTSFGQTRSAARRLQDYPTQSPASNRTRSDHTNSPGGTKPEETRVDLPLLKQRLSMALRSDLVDNLSHLSKASYLGSNQQLFIQAMHHRLARLLPKIAEP